ncbi:hypothetical protein PR048_015813 [Dryococelus australis]|uniref:Uncharacterized protein n=1 Tax=Dryococelus australis TaxID=614101 RepID=A0ABQ9HI71_9NEOP|nr:hypothetical protein PR048_015813 [Dryococelus australis]
MSHEWLSSANKKMLCKLKHECDGNIMTDLSASGLDDVIRAVLPVPQPVKVYYNPGLGSPTCSFKFCQRRTCHTRVTSIRWICEYPTHDLLVAAMAPYGMSGHETYTHSFPRVRTDVECEHCTSVYLTKQKTFCTLREKDINDHTDLLTNSQCDNRAEHPPRRRHRGANPRPSDYKSATLPLSYEGRANSLSYTNELLCEHELGCPPSCLSQLVGKADIQGTFYCGRVGTAGDRVGVSVRENLSWCLTLYAQEVEVGNGPRGIYNSPRGKGVSYGCLPPPHTSEWRDFLCPRFKARVISERKFAASNTLRPKGSRELIARPERDLTQLRATCLTFSEEVAA